MFKNSHHYKGEAVDISISKNPSVKTADIKDCALYCGFNAGQTEKPKDHWHFQRTPGNGVPALPNNKGD